MLILLGADGNNLDSQIAKRFGHANYFILYNTDTKTSEAFENVDEGHKHENLQEFLDKGVEAFIVGNIGPHAFEIINTPKSKVYLARKMSVQDAIEKFLKGELQQLTEPTAKRSIGHGKDREEHGRHHHDGEHQGRGRHNHNE
ncbi:NifB/NifX family molybdenum-iron cluster-binding protein [Melioribacter sp. OK-6-Me]|uniref:NifB/NifX family molybdenum-iron cluster-binding protein n=1 Tax=unclassified Melioribacter TaxID=2627329 RepID=UPI003ED84A73